jgi:prepilin-type processing-associated H-X9-DG protein
MGRICMNRADAYSRRPGFTYIELLALLGIGVILLTIFLPYTTYLRQMDQRTLCQDNLRRLRDALDQYAHDNGNNYPQTLFDPGVYGNGYTAFTGPDAGDPFSVAVGPNDASASLWLLVHDGYVTDLSLFVCPSSNDRPDRLTNAFGQPVPASRRSNFRSPMNLSYSYADPFSGYAGYRLNSDVLPGRFALLADQNPGPGAAAVAYDAPPLALARGNSPNHGQAGQNVLYADGSVSFQSTPYCGVGEDTDRHVPGDNIYTALAPEPLKPGNRPFFAGNGYEGRRFGPSYQYDSYLVPAAPDLRQLRLPHESGRKPPHPLGSKT